MLTTEGLLPEAQKKGEEEREGGSYLGPQPVAPGLSYETQRSPARFPVPLAFVKKGAARGQHTVGGGGQPPPQAD